MKKLLFLAGLLLTILPTLADAQTPPAELASGVQVTGTLSAETFIQTFTFEGSAGDAITLDAFTESLDLALILLLTAPSGAIVAQDSDITTPSDALIADFALPESGQYIVAVLRGEGVIGTSSGDFVLTLSGILTPPTPEAAAETITAATAAPRLVTLENGGITIALGWAAAVNFDIEVRDPVGGAIYSQNPSSASGGVLEADINSNCDAATADSPTETVAWETGAVPVGSYEIILYYVDGCAVGGPQQFTLSATVNGAEPQVIQGTLNPGQQYLAAVEVDAEGLGTLVNGGVNAGLNISLLSAQINAAQTIPGPTVTGALSRETPAIAYTFEGTAGDNVTISMDRTSGNLDPFLILLTPSGTELARNDDRDDGSTNSTVSQQLSEAGTYTIVATRFGQTIGGTEGNFSLTLSLAAPTAALGTGTPAPLSTETAAEITPTVVGTPAASTTTRPADLPTGSVEVILSWNTTADVQLLVRDPAGAAIYDDTPSSTSGGILERAGNARCAGSPSPVSYIYWPTSRLPRGIYEVEVWHQDSCNDPNPVTFNLIVNVQGQELINTSQPSTLGSKFGITFEVDQEGNATAGQGGFFDMEDVSSINYFDLLPDATPIEYGDTVPGTITSEERFQIYSFEAAEGDVVRIAMQRTGGTLDTALYLISPDGVQLAGNDDVVNPVTGERQTNSLLDRVELPTDGTYYIIATHYGLQFGGTVGTYNLTLFQVQ